jgi:hypothetical protein
MARKRESVHRDMLISVVGVMLVVGALVLILNGGIDATGKAIEIGDVAIVAETLQGAFAASGIGGVLPEETNVKFRVLVTSEVDFKEFHISKSGVQAYAGEEVDLDVVIWKSVYKELIESNDYCILKEKVYQYDEKSTFNLLKYIKVNRACS